MSPCCCSYDLYDDATKNSYHLQSLIDRNLRALGKNIKGPIRLQGCEILIFHWIKETVQIEVIIVRLNFHVNISEQFAIHECMRPSLEGLWNMEL